MVGLDLVDENRLLRKRVAELEEENKRLRKYIEVGKKLLDQTNTGKMLVEEWDSRQKLEAMREHLDCFRIGGYGGYKDILATLIKIREVLGVE